MFSDRHLTLIAIVVAVIGLTGLSYLSFTTTAIETSISSVLEDDSLEGRNVELKGYVNNLFLKENNLFFYLSLEGEVKSVYFNVPKSVRENIKENSFVIIQGKIQTYKNEKEIIVERMELA
ncbi:MAG: hypothetical protein ABH821_04275 [archaeon]